MPKRTRAIKKTDRKKGWNRKKRKTPQIEILERGKLFLIVCEGENTEPEYFKSFPVRTATIRTYGLGSTKTKLVEDVIEIIEQEGVEDREVWVVFDMDVKPDMLQQQNEDYNNAIQLAQENDIKVAYSNDAFEIWFLLHYQYFDNQWTRHQYYKKLGEIWDCNYEKQGKKRRFCAMLYKRLQEDERANQQEAMRRAKRLLEAQIELPYSERNPCTTVHCLVDTLNKHIEKDLFLDICKEESTNEQN